MTTALDQTAGPLAPSATAPTAQLQPQPAAASSSSGGGGGSQEFAVGQLVDVKDYGRAVVLGPPVADPADPHFGRVLVKFDEDGKTFHCNPCRLRPLVPATNRVVVCERTAHYRLAAVHNVDHRDVCLEVGSSWGVTTHMLHTRCRYVVGVDIGEFAVSEARRKFPHVRYEVCDGFDVQQLRTLSPSGTFSRVFVDVSGKAPLSLIAQLVGLYLSEFPESLVVVKNEALFRYLDKRRRGGSSSRSSSTAKHTQQQQQQQQASAEGQHCQEQPCEAAEERQGESPCCPLPAASDSQPHWMQHKLAKERQRAQHQAEDERCMAQVEPFCELFRPPW